MYPDGLANEDYCYLTTVGRATGRPHEVEIWFALEDSTIYMLSGGGDRADWVKNIRRDPQAMVRIGNSTFEGQGRSAEGAEEDELARTLLFEKYQPRTGGDLTRWRGSALPMAVDLGLPDKETRNR